MPPSLRHRIGYESAWLSVHPRRKGMGIRPLTCCTRYLLAGLVLAAGFGAQSALAQSNQPGPQSGNLAAAMEQYRRALDAYNAVLPDIVQEQKALGHKIEFADIHSVVTPTDLSGDKVHPSATGYAKMAALWYSVLTGETAPEMAK